MCLVCVARNGFYKIFQVADACFPLRRSRRSAKTALPSLVSPTSLVCLAGVSFTAACPDTHFRMMVPTVPLLKRISPSPTFPHLRMMRSTCRRCVMDSSIAPSIFIDPTVSTNTVYQRSRIIQFQLYYYVILHDIY